MLHLILADSELECIPPEIVSHPLIKKSAMKEGKNPHEMLLDSSLHHQPLQQVPQGGRRGRPDICHMFLLLANESILNKQGSLRVYIHTRNNEIITINPHMRVIKNYNRFKGLCERLFREKKIPTCKDTLMSLEAGTLDSLLKKIHPDHTILFSANGETKNLEDCFTTPNIACIIGGFPKGDFLSPLHPDEIIAIYPSMLPAWIVETKVIVTYENHQKKTVYH